MPSPMERLLDELALAGSRRSQAGSGWVAQAEFESALGAARSDHAAARRPDERDPLTRIRDVFALDDVEAELLWAAAAADQDANIGRAYAAPP